MAIAFVFPFAGGPSVNVWQQLAACTCAALLLVLGPTARLCGPALAWLIVSAGAIVLGRGPDSVFSLSALLVVLVAGLMGLVGAGMARSGCPAQSGRALAWALFAAGLLSAVLGLLQYYGLAEPLVPWTTAPDAGQAYGNLRQRNQFATLISMALIAWLRLYAGSPSRRGRQASTASVLLLLVAQAASTSRTGLLQLFLIVGAAAFMAWRERRAASGSASLRLPSPIALLALLPLYFLIAWVLPRLATGDVEGMVQRLRAGDPSAHSRLLLWHNVIDLIAQHPWTGWGWGELKFAHYSTLYAGPRFVEILDNAHSLPLHLAVELGIPAALLLCGGFAWLVLAARPWREVDPARLMAWGLLGVLVLHSMLEYPLWYGPFQLVFGLCLGFLWPAPSRALPTRWPRRLSASTLSTGAALALVATVGYAAWDYTRVSQVYLDSDQRLPAYRDNPLVKARGSWLFGAAVDFARLTLTSVSRGNAVEMHALAQRVLHFSPEPAVVVKLIESAMLSGHEDEALAQAARFRASFPVEYARWIGGRPVNDDRAE